MSGSGLGTAVFLFLLSTDSDNSSVDIHSRQFHTTHCITSYYLRRLVPLLESKPRPRIDSVWYFSCFLFKSFITGMDSIISSSSN